MKRIVYMCCLLLIVYWALNASSFVDAKSKKWEWAAGRNEFAGKEKISNLTNRGAVLFVWGMANKFSQFDKRVNGSSTDKVAYTRDLVKDYCKIVLFDGDDGMWNNYFITKDMWDFMYSARQSIFVFILCSNVLPKSSEYFPYAFNKKTQYINEYNFSIFGMPKRRCNAKEELLNFCDFSKYWPVIYDKLINDYFNIKQASVYGIYTDKIDKNGSSLDEQANAFLELEMFGELFCDPSWECRYPKVLRKFNSFQRGAMKLFKSVDILNYDAIYMDAKKNKKSNSLLCESNAKINGKYNIVMCGLYDDAAPIHAFSNTLYNELFFYRLFMDYYISVSKMKPKNLTFKSTLASAEKEVAEREYRATKSMMYSTQATNMALQNLAEMFLTYPVHIGFLMLQSDLNKFMAVLAKISPGLVTLSDKMRNAQAPVK